MASGHAQRMYTHEAYPIYLEESKVTPTPGTDSGAHIPQKLTKDQACFRPGRSSCADQLFNLTQHIEEGYERNKLTGVTFVDVSAAYDTVQNRIMTRQLMDMTDTIDLCQVIRGLLSNRRFFVELNDKKSRWRSQKDGLPQ